MQRKWKRRWQRLAKLFFPVAALGMLLISAYNPVYANPTGGTVTAGSAVITAAGATTTITQNTDKAAINWQSFNVGAGERVQFVQPSASSVALNRIVGNDASAIYGTLSANGKVYLINPNGVLFAPGAQVNVGGLVASTLNISDHDFMQGRYTFNGTGAGSVVNQGSLTAGSEVVLLGTAVKNEGLITAKVTGLAAGKQVSLDFNGDKLVNLTVDTGAAGGSAANSGTIKSEGGLVVMSAGTKDALLNTVVNNSGVIRAQSLSKVNGVIRLDGNTAINSGTLDASGKGAGQTGGTVKVLGDTVTLAQGSTIDVSGDADGGTALIGGAYQGGGNEYAATKTTVENGALIKGDALTTGNGGNVVVWANDTTRFAGNISAKGGAVSGNGGSVETSGHNTLKVADTARVTTAAVNGKNGNWLLDPVDVTIGTGGTIEVATLQTALDSSNVTITTGSSSATMTGSGTVSTNTGGNGDITVTDAVSWANTNSLTLSAYRHINVNAAIANTSTAGANVTLRADNTGTGTGTVSFTGGRVNTNGQVTIYYNPLSQVSTTIGGNSVMVNSYANKVDYSSYVKKADAITANNPTAYMLIHTVYDLQYIGTDATTLSGVYALSKDIDASATASWNSGAGFMPIGGFIGSFDGGGHVIDGLTIYRPGTDDVGLFGYTYGGVSISNVGLTEVNITGRSHVGGLVGANYGTVSGSYVSGSVKGSYYSNMGNAGGLVGLNESGGMISSSYANSSVNGTMHVGGLVGRNAGMISGSYASGRVSGSGDVGGLVGNNYQGTISSSYWDVDTTGQVNGVGWSGSSGFTPVYSKSGGASAFAKSSYGNFDFSAAGAWYMIDGSTRPMLKSEYSTTITNGHQLQLMAMDLTQNYTLAKNISLSELQNDAGIWRTSTTADSNGNYGFVPIGKDIWEAFQGSFNGGGYVIDGLTVYRPGTDFVGLFAATYGSISNSISNVGLTNAHIRGNRYVGGLVGVNGEGTVSSCYFIGSVQGTDEVGGLVGENDAGIIDSYASGSVQGTNMVGGLVGENLHTYGMISSSYANGSVSGSYQVGGLVGLNQSAISNSYWDRETTGQASAVGYTNMGGTITNVNAVYSKTSGSSAFFLGSYGGFDFTSTWGIVEGKSYPYLKWRYPTTPEVVSGTVTNAGVGVGGAAVTLLANGAAVGSAITGANGFYQLLLDNNTLSSGAKVLSYVSNISGIGSAAMATSAANANLLGLDIASGAVSVYNASASTLDMNSLLTNAVGSLTGLSGNTLYSVTGTAITITGKLNVSGPAILSGNITTSGDQIYNNAVTLHGSSLMLTSYNSGSASYGSVSFNSTLDGNTALTVEGNAVFGAAIGNSSALAGLTVNHGTASVSGNITTIGNQSYNGAVTLTGNVGLMSASGDIAFGSTLDGANTLAITATHGAVTFGAVGNTASLSALTVDAAGPLMVNSTIKTTGDILLKTAGDLTLSASSSITAANGNVNLVSGGNFSNSNTLGGISVGSGKRYLLYLNNPANLTNLGGLAYDFTQYNASYSAVMGGTVSIADATRNGIVYSDPLIVTVGTAGTLTKGYDGSNAATSLLSNANFAVSAASGSTAVAISSTLDYTGVTAAFDQVNAGSRTVTLEGTAAISNVTDGGKPVYGYTVYGTVTGNTLSGDISTRVITLSAVSGSKTYGQNDPALGVTVSGGSLASTDTLAEVAGTVGRQNGENAGTYDITLGSGSKAGNYNITFTADNHAFTINPALLTVIADAKSKVYGTADPALTYTVSGLASWDTAGTVLTGSLTRSAGETVTGGPYGIIQGTLAANGNYTVSYTGNYLTVTPAVLTVQANDARKYIGSANPVFSYTTSGLAGGDALSDVIQGLSLTTTATSSSQPGAYTIHPAGELISANYTVNWQNGTLTVAYAPWQNQAYYGAVIHADKMAQPGYRNTQSSWQSGYSQGMMPLAITQVNDVPVNIIQQGINLDGIKQLTLDSQP